MTGPLMAVFAIFAVGICDELFHRWRQRRIQRATQWRAVERLIEEKALPEREARFLRAFLKNYAAKQPLPAVTEREPFNACVERDMTDAAALLDEAALREHGELLRSIRSALMLDYFPIGQPIHSTRELTPPQQIFVAPANETGDRWARVRIAAVDEAFLYAHPLELPHGFLPRTGLRLQARLWREEDARYLFTSEIAEIEERPARWIVPHAHDLRRVQARAHFRVRLARDTWVGLVPAPPRSGAADLSRRAPVAEISARLTSLSAGGFAVLVDQPVSEMVHLRIPIDVEDGGEIFEGTGRIVGASPAGGQTYLVRATFVDLDEKQRERIAHFVFVRQKKPQTWGGDHPERTE